MNFEQTFATPTMSKFTHRLLHRLKALLTESGGSRVVMPVGIFLLIDKANGGDATAAELAARFHLLDFESRNLVDFYFLGWQSAEPERSRDEIRFDLDEFAACRSSLRAAGVSRFGGNSDLLLVDAIYEGGYARLDFRRGCRIDLSRAVAEKEIASLGGFLQSVIDAAEIVAASREDAGREGVVYSISDHLGLAIARSSIIDYFLKRWGEIIGAKKLAHVAVRDLGPEVDLAHLLTTRP